MTLNLTTGAATSGFTGHLSPLGADTGYDNLAFTLTGPSTFTYTGTRTFVAANGDKLFSAITGKGTFTSTAAHSTETDTITGGTGRFAGASGTYTDTISNRRHLGHFRKPDKPRHRRRPRPDPLLGQIGPEGPLPAIAGPRRQRNEPARSPRPGGFGYNEVVSARHHRRGDAGPQADRPAGKGPGQTPTRNPQDT